MRDRRSATLVTLVIIYFTLNAKEFSNVSLPSALPAIDVSVAGPVATLLPATGTVFYSSGKFIVTALTQAIGARKVLLGSTLLTGFGLLICASPGASYTLLLMGWSLAQFGTAQIWIACYGLAVLWVDRIYFGRVIAFVFAIGSDGGGAIGSFVFSSILHACGSSGWPFVFLLTGGFMLCMCVVLAACVHASAEDAGFEPPDQGDGPRERIKGAAHPLASAPLATALHSFMTTPRYWLALAAGGGYTVSFMTMQSYCALYASRRLGVSADVSARMVSAAMAGSATGGILGGLAVDALRGAPLIALAGAYKLGAVAIGLTWLTLDIGLASGGQPWPLMATQSQQATMLALALFWIFGSIEFSWAPILGRACAKIGGPRHAATAIGILDCFGFVLRVPFAYMFGSMLEEGSLISTALLLWLLVLLVAHAAVLALIVLDERGASPHGADPASVSRLV